MAVHPGNGHSGHGHQAVSGRGKTLNGLVYGAGAALSVALVIGVGVWGYNLVMRDVSGVPVVKASADPMRITPEDPGGAPAENQGLAVNSVAADGVAEKPADRLTLAPRPVDLAKEDGASAQLDLIKLTRDLTDTAPVETTEVEDPVEAVLKEIIVTTPEDGAVFVPENETQVALLDIKPEPTVPVLSGVKASLRPKLRPSGLRPVVSAPKVEATREVDPNGLAVGTRLAQLGAYESVAVAQSEWTRLSDRFDDYFDEKQRVIQKAQSGGRTFYRLRVHGFADLSDARRFCSALVAERAECIPVTHK